jgi:hypothetical protein
MTLSGSTLTGFSGFAADSIVQDTLRGKAGARLLVIDLRELARPRDKSGARPETGGQHGNRECQFEPDRRCRSWR